jgi:2-polyprenyl-3-methyl-5-hydroxy-6-metoxy-1,4-benzoquinol methylase
VRGPRSAAARRALSVWDDAPLGDRFHTRARWWSAPFAALEREVPRSGDILEIGCGHGVFSTYLAVSSPARRVVGVDIDADKIALAVEATGHLDPDEGDLTFRVSESGDVPSVDGGWRCIVFADVLYLLPRARREALLAECASALAPDGVLVVKEVDTRPVLKAKVSQLQELVATRVLRITDGDALDFPSSDELVEVLVDLGLDVSARRLDQGYLHPHCVVVGRRPPG